MRRQSKALSIPLTVEEIALLQCAIVHCELFWEPDLDNPRRYHLKDVKIEQLMAKLHEAREKLESE